MVPYFNYARLNDTAEPAPGADVTVYFPAGQTVTKATLYEDEAGTIPLNNPFQANTGDINPGYFRFYVAEEGLYDLAFSGGGITTPFAWGDVPVVNVSDDLGWFNVKDYGAVGDGVTDDRAAIQAAIEACGPGQTVYFPTTEFGYLLDSVTAAGVSLVINNKRGIRLLGAGLRSCLLLGANAGTSTHAMHITNSPYYTIRDLSLGTKVLTGQFGDGIRIGGNTTLIVKLHDSVSYGSGTNRSDYGYIDNVWINGFRNQLCILGGQTTRTNAIRIQAPSSNAGPYAAMANGTVGGCGVYINGGSQGHGWQMVSPQIEGTGSWGLYSLNAFIAKITGGTLEGTGDGGPILNIASSTNTSPIQITFTANHNMLTGQQTYIHGHEVNTAANGIWSLTVVNATTISLDDTVGNGVGGATGTGEYLQGDIFFDGYGAFQNSVLDVYSETGVPTTRNLLICGGIGHSIVNGDFQGGVTQVFEGNRHAFRGVLSNRLIVGEGCQGLTFEGPVIYGTGGNGFENYSGRGGIRDLSGLANFSNTYQQVAGIRGSSLINYARNGGFERWVSATSLDAPFAGGFVGILGGAIARIGDGMAVTEKFAGHYSMSLTSAAGGPTAEYQGPRPRYVDNPMLGVTVSVWARSVSGSKNFSLGIVYFPGGATHSQSFVATTTWQLFSATFPFREGNTDYAIRFNIGDPATTIYFDNFFLTDGWAGQLGDWDNAKLQEQEPIGRTALTFADPQVIYGDAATFQTVFLQGNTTLTFSGWIPGVPVLLKFTQDGGGGRLVTWPAVNWVGGVAPTVTATANRSCLFMLVYDGSAYWEISRALDVY